MNIKNIKSHFKQKDPLIYSVMQHMDLKLIKANRDPSQYYLKLCQDIISQQLGDKAATAIIDRFIDLFPNKQVTPENVLSISDQKLRGVGMSWAKAKYIKNLAEKTRQNELPFHKLLQMEDELVITELTKVKGIGRWTAEMFLIFTLGRPDVYSHHDLGLKRALQKLYQLKDRPSVEEADKITHAWIPYRSYGSLALWASLET